MRVTYWLHGAAPSEQFLVDGRAVEPAYGKFRACRYFRRDLLRQRIVWLPANSDATSLHVTLGGVPAQVAVGPQPFRARGEAAVRERVCAVRNRVLEEAHRTFPPGRGGPRRPVSGWTGWKVRLVKAVAKVAALRPQFRDAWVFVDRDEDADDNAEHLYRWVRKEHPEINAWFLLQPASRDWHRLAQEGFRLMRPGIGRRLLLLNSTHIISSHLDYWMGSFDPGLYGDAMRWRFTYLKHGVLANDLSHAYAKREFDCLITPGPQEHLSVVGDDTPYDLTRRAPGTWKCRKD